MRFAFVLNGQVKEFRDYPSQPACKVIDGLPTIRPVETAALPSYDARTHRLERAVEVFDDRVEEGWNVIALAPEEVQPRYVPVAIARERLEVAGFWDALVLSLAPARLAKLLSLRIGIAADDQEAIQVLTSIGADPAAILAPEA